MVFMRWMDTRKVPVCSIIHQEFSGSTVQRRIKTLNGDWPTKSIPYPTHVMEYNTHMGGVDLSDQLIQYLRWYQTLFLHFLDIATTNSFLLHKELCREKQEEPMTHRAFLEELTAQLCGLTVVVPPAKAKSGHLPVAISNQLDTSRKASYGLWMLTRWATNRVEGEGGEEEGPLPQTNHRYPLHDQEEYPILVQGHTWLERVALASLCTRETPDLMVQPVFRLHGIPLDIVSDRGPQFISQEREIALPSVLTHLRCYHGKMPVLPFSIPLNMTGKYAPGQKVCRSSRNIPLKTNSRNIGPLFVCFSVCLPGHGAPFLPLLPSPAHPVLPLPPTSCTPETHPPIKTL
ncbi:uncharacterized protein LOC122867068 [Siniperca chuatsi]|uniref:uncharacterized protein LOC122867068 n=1 Tax=Siniperca chuatsi TaxID=119488 RepID=UPI001CE1FC83|nr:uncharacterized protein LOC122867068 [Siniperca chuatsi]